MSANTPKIQFERIIGRNILMQEANQVTVAQTLAKFLHPEGMVVLAETIPRHTQRLYRLLDPKKVGVCFYEKLGVAEERIYNRQSDSSLDWDENDLETAFEIGGLAVEMETEPNSTQMHITPTFLNRLFARNTTRPSYADYLAKSLQPEELETVEQLFTQHLLNQTVTWESTMTYVVARRKY